MVVRDVEIPVAITKYYNHERITIMNDNNNNEQFIPNQQDANMEQPIYQQQPVYQQTEQAQQPIYQQQPYQQQPEQQMYQQPGPSKQIAPLGKKRLLVLGAVVLAILLLLGIGVYAARYELASMVSPHTYVGMVIDNTNAGLQGELNTMVDSKPVLSAIKSASQGQWEMRFTAEDGYEELTITADHNPNTGATQIVFGIDDEKVEIYADDSLFVISAGGESFGLNLENFAEEYKAYCKKNGIDYNDAADPDIAQKLLDTYSPLLGRIMDYAEYSIGAEDIKIGDKNVNCKVATIVIDKAAIGKWLNLVAATIENDKNLIAMGVEESNIYELTDAIDELREIIDGKLELKLYIRDNKVIVWQADFTIDGQNVTLGLGTVGDRYMLDDIYISMGGSVLSLVTGSMGGDMRLEMAGEHIDGTVFKSKVSAAAMGTSMDLADIEWDTAQTSGDNFKISSSSLLGSFEYSFMLAKDGDGARFKIEDFADGYYDSELEVTFKKSGKEIKAPARYKNILDLLPSELTEIFSDIF